MVMASRLIYGMAAQGIVPRTLGRVHRGRRTPWVAILFTTALAVLLISIGSLETLADTTVMLLLVVFTCVNVAVLALRGDRVGHEHFRAPSALPVIGALTCIALVIRTLVDEPATVGYAAALLAVGALLWVVARLVTGPARELDPQQLVD